MVVIFRFHELVLVALVVEVLGVGFRNFRLLHLVGTLEGMVDDRAGEQILELGAKHRPGPARLGMLVVHNEVRLAVEEDALSGLDFGQSQHTLIVPGTG